MVDDDKVTMTAQDIAVMRQIIAWRKANEIEFVKRRVYGAPYWVDTLGRTGPRRRSVTVEIDHYDFGPNPLGLAPSGRDLFTWIPASSFGQAVDVLVAYGYLPMQFSSVYREGWDAAMDDEHVMHDESRYPAAMPND